MYYAYQKESGRGKLYTLEAKRVKEIKEMNKQGEKPADLVSLQVIFETDADEVDMGFEDVTGVIELPEEKRSKKRRKKKKPSRGKGSNSSKGGGSSNKSGDAKKDDSKSRSRGRRRKGGRGNKNDNGNKGDGDKS
jgi:hypothetical protein